MKIAILQPTPFRKGHYYIYTKSLLNEIKNLRYKVKVISATKTFSSFHEEESNLNFNIYSIRGLIIYICLCYSTIFRFVYFRNYYNCLIVLDCEYSCLSILLVILKLLNWKGKVTVQINAPNFEYNFKKEGLRFFSILKYVQSFIFRASLNLCDLRISCLGKWHKNKLSKQLSFNEKRIFIIEDGGGGEIQEIQESNLNKRLQEESINFPDNKKKVFLLFGNIRKDKGHLFLSSFWNKYFSSKEDPYLWIVGHDEEKLSQKIISKRSPNIVVHNSYVPFELISCIYQKSNFAILPYLSSYKGGSGPLMKGAFTHSRLAIVANVSEMGRLAKEENLAEYFKPENELSLLSCIKKILLNNDEHYINKIKFAKKYANDRNWKNLAKEFIKTFK